MDRILHQQKVERARAEAARLQLERERKEAQETEARELVAAAKNNAIEPVHVPEKGGLINQVTPRPPVVDVQPKGSRQSVLGSFNSFRQKFTRAAGGGDRGNESETKSLLSPPGDNRSPLTPIPRAPSPSGQVTSQESIGKSGGMIRRKCSNFFALCREQRSHGYCCMSPRKSIVDPESTTNDNG